MSASRGVRDDGEGAGAIGVNLIRSHIPCFLWTAPFLGIAGGVIALQKLRVAPASLSIADWTVHVIFIAVVGVWRFILLGELSTAVIWIEPRGLWGPLRRIVPQDLIPSRMPRQNDDEPRLRTPKARPHRLRRTEKARERQ